MQFLLEYVCHMSPYAHFFNFYNTFLQLIMCIISYVMMSVGEKLKKLEEKGIVIRFVIGRRSFLPLNSFFDLLSSRNIVIFCFLAITILTVSWGGVIDHISDMQSKSR